MTTPGPMVINDIDDLENNKRYLTNILLEFQLERTCDIIADDLKLEQPEPIPTAELRRFANRLDLESSVRRSFIRAELVFLAYALDQEDAPRYVAVEISWTVGQSDIDRTRRNAALIQRATGVPTLAAAFGNDYEDGLDWREVARISLT